MNTFPGVAKVDPRLVWQGNIQEISNFTIDPNTYATLPVGDSRQGESLIVGVEPQNVTSSWFLQGRLLIGNSTEAIVGDSTARFMFDVPLSQSFRLRDTTFNIVGVCLDPINNGMVVYVPLEKLENLTNTFSPNIVIIELDSSADRAATSVQLRQQIKSINPDLTVD